MPKWKEVAVKGDPRRSYAEAGKFRRAACGR